MIFNALSVVPPKQAWHGVGLPVSTVSNEAAKMFDAVLTQFVASISQPAVGGIMTAMQRLQDADPEFGKAELFSL